MEILKDIRKIYAGLNADEIRGAAYRDVNIGLMAVNESSLREMERFLAPLWLDPSDRADALKNVHSVDGAPRIRFDFVIAEPGIPLPPNGYVFNPEDSDFLAREIARNHDDLDLALGRRFPAFRRAVADRIIHRISRENALFALVTALPNIIPSALDLPWAIGEFATDTAFLTMNQIRMALLMSAVYGHPIAYGEQKGEIAVIVGGAFGWRALARELMGKIPLGGGLIPKAAVAFAGTYVVGMGLERLNRTGIGFSRRERKDAWADAMARGKREVDDFLPEVASRTGH